MQKKSMQIRIDCLSIPTSPKIMVYIITTIKVCHRYTFTGIIGMNKASSSNINAYMRGPIRVIVWWGGSGKQYMVKLNKPFIREIKVSE